MAIEIHTTGKSVGHLRAKAKKLARAEAIPLHKALDEVVLDFYRNSDWTYDAEAFIGNNHWARFRENVWTLRPDGILERTEGKPQQQYYEGVKLPSHYPNGRRFELDIGCLRSGVAVPLKSRDGIPIMELPLEMRAGFNDLKTRLYRSVDRGVLVQRLHINDAARCFDGSLEWPGHCDCCMRHEQHNDRQVYRESYNRALRENSLKHMAEWVVGCFESSVWISPASDGYLPIITTPEAEAIIAHEYVVDDEIEAICDADDLLNGRDPAQRFEREREAAIAEAQRLGVQLQAKDHHGESF